LNDIKLLQRLFHSKRRWVSENSKLSNSIETISKVKKNAISDADNLE